jgi:hypothetical protein
MKAIGGKSNRRPNDSSDESPEPHVSLSPSKLGAVFAPAPRRNMLPENNPESTARPTSKTANLDLREFIAAGLAEAKRVERRLAYLNLAPLGEESQAELQNEVGDSQDNREPN